MIEVDVRGLSCPIPVVRTRKAMDENPTEPVSVLVDSAVSKENVSRLAKAKGYSMSIVDAEGGLCLVLSPPGK